MFPRFGAYSATSTAGLQRTSPVTTAAGDVYGLSNFTEADSGNNFIPPIVEDFYQHAAATSPQKGFTKAADGDSDGWVSGDKYAKQNSSTSWSVTTPPTYVASSTYADNVQHLLNYSSVGTSTRDWKWELDGYSLIPNPTTVSTRTDYQQAPFNGYTQGPRYWGKTFFTWPPDPRYPLGNNATDRNVVKQFLTEFGFSGTDATNISGQWPFATAGALDTYLQSISVTPADPRYNFTMRLHNRPNGDWRKRFFLKSDGITPVDDNNLLWNSSGNWRSPQYGGTEYYKINYQAILDWLFNSGTNPFPPRLHAGRINYYDALPNATDTGLNARWWGTYPVSDLNERFWKQYVDYAIGLRQTGATTWDTQSTTLPNIVSYTGYGDDFAWNTTQITPASSLTLAAGSTAKPYVHYSDNPKRPRLHLWFGPMSMVDFLGNYNLGGRASYQTNWWWPGTCHEAPLYACKIGVRAALQDIERNHPNDSVCLIMFNVPRASANDTTNGRRFNRPRTPLGRNYVRMIDSLWFPAYSLDNGGVDIRPYDFEPNLEVPRAMGGTCYSIGLMLAYNQFSGRSDMRTFNPSPAPSGDAGGLGRKGAQKMVIFETDGQPNQTATASFASSGSYNSYYRVRYNSSSLGSSEYPSVAGYTDNDPTVTNEIFGICRQLAAADTAANPGYGTVRKPVLIHTIGFGPAVEPSSSDRPGAIATLSQMETIGNIPAAKRIDSVSYKTIYGTPDQMVNRRFLSVQPAGIEPAARRVSDACLTGRPRLDRMHVRHGWVGMGSGATLVASLHYPHAIHPHARRTSLAIPRPAPLCALSRAGGGAVGMVYGRTGRARLRADRHRQDAHRAGSVVRGAPYR